MHAHAQSNSATLWTAAHQAPLSMGFSKQDYWSKLPLPPPGIFLTQGWNQCLLCLLHWQVDSFTTELLGKSHSKNTFC